MPVPLRPIITHSGYLVIMRSNFKCLQLPLPCWLPKCIARIWRSIPFPSLSLRSCPIWLGHWFLWQSLLVGRLWEQGGCQEGLRCLEQGVWTGAISGEGQGWWRPRHCRILPPFWGDSLIPPQKKSSNSLFFCLNFLFNPWPFTLFYSVIPKLFALLISMATG